MSVITATIKSNGKEMSPEYELLSIDVIREFNKVPYAELQLIDGDVAANEYSILDSEFFTLGNKIEIALRYEGEVEQEKTVFIGIVTHQGLELNRTGTTLSVELSDESIRMTHLRKNALYAEKKDSEIIKKLVQEYGLKAGKITPTNLAHAQMVQYYVTDWDFILARAEANGHLLKVVDGEISTVEPEVGQPEFELELGKDTIYDMDLKVDGTNQYQHVESVAWNIAQQQLSKPVPGRDPGISQGNYNLKDIAQGQTATLMHPVSLHPDELRSWSGARLMRSRLSLFRGWIKIPGTSQVRIGQTIGMKGVSNRFSGKNIISGVRHQVTAAGWVTHIQIGMDMENFMTRTNVMEAPAAGLLPGVNGLQIGSVVAHEKDPENEFRVKVSIPAFDDKKGTVWARLTSPDAGTERGIFFRPEIGDEVVIGFLNDDPRQAIVLGAMYSSAHQPPADITPQNGQKGIFTKKKYQLLFDEEKEIITLSTSKKNSIQIDENNGLIAIQDAHGNRVEMSESGVIIDSAKDLKIAAAGDLEIAAKGNIKIDGKKVDLI